MVFGKFVRWLGGGKSTRDYIIDLKMVNKRLARSSKKLETDEQKLQRKTRDAMRRGLMDQARLYASNVARNRKWVYSYTRLTTRIEGIIFRLEQADSVQQLASELKGMAGALREVNASLNAPEISALVEDLENSFEGIEMTTDMMDEDFESMMSLDVDETEVDKIMGEIGTEIGLGAETGLPTPDIRSTELAKEIEKLREDKE
ncbi:MAG: Snf7 family protein [Candidatus Heimdallarchaeota archaeon]|jgi:division protein CdvB (Snf7/Vps24/ESCRT-III family)|nr:Snf7 family protein [Candidatus Heimdallarchaeota archaeon]MBY8994773.1 Snf7 family protein [Candidatus Heimdallarchaeota archaeon]